MRSISVVLSRPIIVAMRTENRSSCIICLLVVLSSDKTGGKLLAEGLSLRACSRGELEGDQVLPIIGHLPAQLQAKSQS